MPGQSRPRPHPFLWLLLAALAPALALYWNPIYRADALVVLAIAYLLGTAGWMAWHELESTLDELIDRVEPPRRVSIPGKAVVEHLRRYAELQREAARRGR